MSAALIGIKFRLSRAPARHVDLPGYCGTCRRRWWHGRELAEQRDARQLKFTDRLRDGEGSEILLASGVLHSLPRRSANASDLSKAPCGASSSTRRRRTSRASVLHRQQPGARRSAPIASRRRPGGARADATRLMAAGNVDPDRRDDHPVPPRLQPQWAPWQRLLPRSAEVRAFSMSLDAIAACAGRRDRGGEWVSSTGLISSLAHGPIALRARSVTRGAPAASA